MPALVPLLGGVLLGALLSWGWFTTQGPDILPPEAGHIMRPAVCFTPGEKCTDRIVATIGAAQREVLVQAYSFTSPPIAEALEAAHRRGVRVRILVDDSQISERYTQADEMAAAGIEVWVDDPSGIAHNKVMVIDGELVITGSFNFSRSAQERNTENLLLIRDATLAAQYTQNWERRRAVSTPYAEAARPPAAANDNERDRRKRDSAIFGLF
ncbi:phospholipase D family protein [Roseomonas xinghualingensis]|uniref:phospholipase D family nuclease n=1 Tax=Roseomonas xinghualingensis TaxID=2986475 RepID=UPI0021F1A066|nr:phospholipase D family protein [Roseomonas sp. SXEYE001]MCV4208117.1 phospholipase D family protein [Roseomonas sp. SXEYE001]